MDIDALISLLKEVPDVVWSGIVASVITLAGVFFSNRGNTRRLQLQLQHDSSRQQLQLQHESSRQKLQLEHDSSERAKERLGIIRREVYLTAAEEMTRATRHIGNLPNLDPSQNMNDGLAGFFQSAAKVQLVSDFETSKMVGELATRAYELMLRIITKVRPLQDIRDELKILEATRDKALSDIKAVLTAMDQARQAEPFDARAFSALQESAVRAQGALERSSGDLIEAMRRRLELQKKFTREVLVDVQPMVDAQTPLTVALRSELGVSGDLEEFRKRLEANGQRLKAALETEIAKLDAIT